MNLKKLIIPTLVAVLMIIGFVSIKNAHQDYFRQVEQAYSDHQALNLKKGVRAEELKAFIIRKGYAESTEDAAFIARHIAQRLHEGEQMKNLGALNTPAFRCKAAEAEMQGGDELRRRVENSRAALGWNETVQNYYEKQSVASTSTQQEGGATLTVSVVEEDTTQYGFFTRIWNTLTGRHRKPVQGTLVRLKEHYYEGEKDSEGHLINPHAADTVVAYAMTNQEGKVQFNVIEGHSYSVLPIRKDFEFGASQGTTGGSLSGDRKFRFIQKPHTITLFAPITYQHLKADGMLTVRTPQEFNNMMITDMLLFIICWLAAFIIMHIRNRQPELSAAHIIASIAMMLTALSLMMMFSITHPLTDTATGNETTWGICMGVAAMTILTNVNITWLHRLTEQNLFGWIARPFTQKLNAAKIQEKDAGPIKIIGYYVRLILAFICLPLEGLARLASWIADKTGTKTPEGAGYAFVAVMLMFLLYLFGTGPEGSDAKVNLWGFQPSEITKLLIVFFMAAFFAKNAKRIQTFSRQPGRFMLKMQVKTVASVAACLLILILMYLKLSDLGPALVVITTFVLMYAVARKDFVELTIGTASFIILLWIGSVINPGSTTTPLLLALLWFVAWIGGGWLWKHRIYESALFMNLLITAFVFGGTILSQLGMAEGERLDNRSAMAWNGVWDNNVPGGDQVAQGIWSLAAGGTTGQGMGEGHANLVPACNTDMIFTSIGETLGWLALAVIVILFFIMLHHSLLIARKAGMPFAFFLVSGIGIITAVQFLVIVTGSTGLIPLTGVTLPFLSFGKSGIIMNLAATGIICSVARMKATRNQMADIRQYDGVLSAACLAFIIVAVVILATTFNCQVVNRDKFILKPAYTANLNGVRIQEYNPRIALLVNQLPMGDVYDRNGLLLATSDPQKISKLENKYSDAGISRKELASVTQRRLRRYYPFADRLFFFTGDFNTRVLWNNNDLNPYGYMAENKHLATLRGFDNTARDNNGHAILDRVESSTVKESRFLKPLEKEGSEDFVRRDYSELLPFLLNGNFEEAARNWNRHQDITLSVDATLQTAMQEKMSENQFVDFKHSLKPKMRASVVVVDTDDGSVLCSANYPQPSQEEIQRHADIPYYERIEADMAVKAYADRDLGLTYQTKPGSTAKIMSAMAGFMKYGKEIIHTTYILKQGERISHAYADTISLREAIVRSSNSFFVNFVHDKQLYSQLDTIYQLFGVNLQIDWFKGYDRRNRSITPYFFDLADNDSIRSLEFSEDMEYLAKAAYSKYDEYQEKKKANKNYVEKMSDPKLGWTTCGSAWGQYNIKASPLNMALMSATVANDGLFIPAKFVISEPSANAPKRLLSREVAGELKNAMEAESDKNLFNIRGMGGKTGTPQRVFNHKPVNDAWYTFFIPKHGKTGYLAVALRIERSMLNSKSAVKYTKDVVLPILKQTDYIQ